MKVLGDAIVAIANTIPEGATITIKKRAGKASVRTSTGRRRPGQMDVRDLWELQLPLEAAEGGDRG